jgi:DNA-binding transcriptional MerR regulator
MEYTVQKLARLAGVSARTLRYYDRIGLLKPAGTTASGYRIYGRAEVDLLQQILFYRELGFSLNRIREAHAGIAQAYVEDERFKAYYDARQPGTAQFLRDAVLIYTGVRP